VSHFLSLSSFFLFRFKGILTSLQLPSNSTLPEAITLGNNFVTVFHAVTTDLHLPLPWPVPTTAPPRANDAILVWGGSSSVGQYALQILRHWGYTNLLATSSLPHHSRLKSYGAKYVFDYKSPSVVEEILDAAGGRVRLVLDCIGSKEGSLKPIAKIAKNGDTVAVLLPVIVKDASDTDAPVYSMVVDTEAEWEEGVDARGVRTHFYLDVSSTSLASGRLWG
jgi:NADPH:quinone reductase-like Zn-dependent oxidoreductase